MSSRTAPNFFSTRRRSVPVAVLLAVVLLFPALAQGQALDGITIVDYAAGGALGDANDHIVTFVSPLGIYAAVVPKVPSSYTGCFSLGATTESGGTKLSFGIDADLDVRKQRLQTICQPFTLELIDRESVRLEIRVADQIVTETRPVVARIPWGDLDYAAAPFTTHDIKGVHLGPVDPKGTLGPLPAKPSYTSTSLRKRVFRRQVTTQEGKRSNVLGDAAPREITGWSKDVLYRAQFIESFGQISSTEAFEKAVHERYGKPSSNFDQTGYKLWAFDLDGSQVALDSPPPGSAAQDEPAPGLCAATLQPWLKKNPDDRIFELDWNFWSRKLDLGPWGCSLLLEVNPTREDGGIDGYSARAVSGYVLAVNHFAQRIEEVQGVMKKVKALLGSKPRL